LGQAAVRLLSGRTFMPRSGNFVSEAVDELYHNPTNACTGSLQVVQRRLANLVQTHEFLWRRYGTSSPSACATARKREGVGLPLDLHLHNDATAYAVSVDCGCDPSLQSATKRNALAVHNHLLHRCHLSHQGVEEHAYIPNVSRNHATHNATLSRGLDHASLGRFIACSQQRSNRPSASYAALSP
jgi:hypothetical protein